MVNKKIIVAVVCAIIVIAAASGGYYYYQIQTVTQTTTSTASSTTSAVAAPSTLVIDDAEWPVSDLNIFGPVLFPNWLAYADLQPLLNPNDTMLYANGTLQYLPCLATGYTVSADGLSYTFNLQKNVTFSSGKPFNAYMVWYEIYAEYYLSGNSSTYQSGYDIFYDHMGTAHFGPATLALMSQSGLVNPSQSALSVMMDTSWPIYVTGPYQIVFRLRAPFDYLPSVLMYTGMGDMQYVIDNGGPGTPGSPNPYFNTNPVPGTGPYLVKAMSERSWVEFTQNPNYWGKNLNASEIAGDVLLDPGHVTNVIIYYKSDDIARFTDLKNGAAQIAAIQAADWAAVMTNPTTFSYVHLPPWAQYVFLLAFNTQIAPTNNVDFRQALVHAINYTDLNKKAFFSTASEFVPPEYPAYSNYYNLGNYQPYTYNLTLAKMYLAASKVNTTTMSPMVIRLVSGCPYCETSAEVIQQDFAQLNIPSNIVVLAPSAYYAPWGGYAYDVVPANAAQLGNINVNGGENWAPSALTPADSYVDWVSNGSLGTGDMAVYYNPIVQACVNSFFDGTSLTNQQVICAKAQTQVYNDAPYTGYTLGLWWVDGSLTWLQNGPIKSFALDPMFVGETTAPIFNTVTFASSNTQGGSMSSIAPMFLVRDAQRSYGWLPVLSTKWQAT